MRPRWHPTAQDDAAIRDGRARGLRVPAIAAQIGVSDWVIYRRIGELGLPKRERDASLPGPVEWTSALVAQLHALWAEGLSTIEIGRRLGMSKNAVIGKAHRLGLPARPSPIRGGKGGAAAVAKARERSTRRRSGPPPIGGAPSVMPAARDYPLRASVEPAGAAAQAPPPVVPAIVTKPPAIRGGCRWPLWGNERPTHEYCDAPRAAWDCPYCPAHRARAYERRAEAA